MLPLISSLYELEGYKFKPVDSHEGGRNVIFTCEKEGGESLILRIAYLKDRSREDFVGELEYVRYLFQHGGSVSDVVNSKNGNLLEEITYHNQRYFISVFIKAKGKMLVENNYKYRKGAPLTEYFYNCGKTLGKLHQISKGYRPNHARYSFFDKFNIEYIHKLIPDSFSDLKNRLIQLLDELAKLDRNENNFGMVHFDYNDGNYSIDFENGQITVYDFDNSCYCWYMFDLANVWMHGVGWIQFEPDAGKRKEFMDEYFNVCLEGYRSETEVEDAMLDKLPLFIQVNLIEWIVDEFEVMKRDGEEPEYDEDLAYRIKCLVDDIPYLGFFHDMYSCEAPFQYEEANKLS